ncbi:MAG: 50S ribosomal protein L35 [Spiroplasma sp.]|nr:50S ribosomal protein L35 [Spiroplasma sp.]
MPKMKTKKALKKRIKVTGTGKWMRGSAFVSHLAPNKTTKQKRQSRGWTTVSKSDYTRLKDLI